jgi:hypothetical protein
MMPGSIDFSMPAAVAASAAMALCFPFVLLVSARVRSLTGRHSHRFLVSALLTLGLQGALLCIPRFSPHDRLELMASICLMAGALLFYLEVWALMNRGYTLAILRTLLEAGKPLSAEDIFRMYRAGEGLGWIMQHRIGGLCAAGLIRRESEQLTLNAGRGVMIARLYGICISVLGLARTG